MSSVSISWDHNKQTDSKSFTVHSPTKIHVHGSLFGHSAFFGLTRQAGIVEIYGPGGRVFYAQKSGDGSEPIDDYVNVAAGTYTVKGTDTSHYGGGSITVDYVDVIPHPVYAKKPVSSTPNTATAKTASFIKDAEATVMKNPMILVAAAAALFLVLRG